MWDWRRLGEAHDTARHAPRSPREIYEEPAFRHFLGLERKRAERRGRSLVLLLVDMAPRPHSRRLEPGVGETVFGILETCVRESDFLGWYDTARVAGAVLVQGDTPPSEAACHAIGKSVVALLHTRLPVDVVTDVRVLKLAVRHEGRHEGTHG